MPKAAKIEKVKELSRRFKSGNGAVFADFRGLTVKDATELRRTLRQAEASLHVVKNTLSRIVRIGEDRRLQAAGVLCLYVSTSFLLFGLPLTRTSSEMVGSGGPSPWPSGVARRVSPRRRRRVTEVQEEGSQGTRGKKGTKPWQSFRWVTSWTRSRSSR